MKLTDYSVKNWMTVFVLMFAIVIVGSYSYIKLPREASPDITIPFIVVTTPYTGVSPADMENLVTRKLEDEFTQLSDVKEMRSVSQEGLSSITIEFNPNVDIDDAFQRVKDKVDLAKPELPDDADDPMVNEINFSEFPIMIVGLGASYDPMRLKEVAEDLQDEIENVSGILRVNISGALEREIKVNVDPVRLQAHKLALEDVIEAISREDVTIPGGTIDVGKYKYLVRVPGEIRQVSTIEDLVIEDIDGPVRISDIATVVYSFKERETISRLDGASSITLAVQKRTGENLIRVADQVMEVVEKSRATLPAGTEVTIINDISLDIRRMVLELENNVLSGLVLVVTVLFIFLGFRNSWFVALAIPMSMLIAFAILFAFDITLNMVVLFSLILVLGMLVDNAIVIVENIYRHRTQEGRGADEASMVATHEVAWPVIASTITTICAFGPMVFWPGIMGEFMSYLPKTVIIVLSASLFVALVINPTVCAKFMKVGGAKSSGNQKKDWFTDGGLMRFFRAQVAWALSNSDGGGRRALLLNWVVPFLPIYLFVMALFLVVPSLMSSEFQEASGGGFGDMFAAAPFAMALGFLSLLVIAVHTVGFAVIYGIDATRLVKGRPPTDSVVTDNRARVLHLVYYAFFLSVVAYSVLGTGVEFFPDIEPRDARVTLEAPSGTNVETSDGYTLGVEEAVRRVVEEEIATHGNTNIKHYVGDVGSPDQQQAMFGGGGSSHRSVVTVSYLDTQERQFSSLKTTDALRSKLQDLAGVDVDITKSQEGPPTGPPINVEVSGEDVHVLGEIADKIKKIVEGVEGAVNVANNFDAGRPEVQIRIDRDKAAALELNTRSIALTVRTAINGTKASSFRVGEDEYDVTVRLAERSRRSLDDLERLHVVHEGKQIPLTAVANVSTSGGLGAINRLDRERVVIVSADVEGRNANEALEEAVEKLSGIEIPPGYSIKFTGESEEQDAAAEFLSQVFVAEVILISLVLVTQFNSVTTPTIIMFSVLMSMIGVMWGLIITGLPFGIIMTGVGVISLGGVVVNNAIVLIDYIRQLEDRGLPRKQAIIDGACVRLRPVVLTAITTVMGLIPLTTGLNVDFRQLFGNIFSWTWAPVVSIGGESSQWWGPMGVAVIFGLVVATGLTLVVVPVMYSVVSDATQGVGRLLARRSSAAEPVE